MDDRGHDQSHKNRKRGNQIDLKMSADQNTISFLIGSGFSVPANLPFVPCINNMVSNLTAADLSISPSEILAIIERGRDLDRFNRTEEKKFFEDFIRFYKKKVRDSETEFHYEEFYDYYTDQRSKLENHRNIDSS